MNVPKNMTGVFVTTNDPMHPKSRQTVPPLSRAIPIDKKLKNEPPIIQSPNAPQDSAWKKRDNCRSSFFELFKRHKQEREEPLSSRRKDYIKKDDSASITQLTKPNQRNFTKINNSGEKYFLPIGQSTSPHHNHTAAQREEYTGGWASISNPYTVPRHMTTSASTVLQSHQLDHDAMAEELKRSRRHMLGIEICLRNVCSSNPDTVYTLLPKRRSCSTNTTVRTKSRPYIGTGELLAQLPQEVPMKTGSLKAHPSGPSLYKVFGQEEKVEQYHHRLIALRTGRAVPVDRYVPPSFLTKSSLPNNQRILKPNNSTVHFSTQGYRFDQPHSLRGGTVASDARKQLNSENDFHEIIPYPSRAETNLTNRKDPDLPINRTDIPSFLGDQPLQENPNSLVGEDLEDMSINIAVQDEAGVDQNVVFDASDEARRRQSVEEQMVKGREESEYIAEVIRQTAESRRRELADLLDEHDQLVHEIDRMSNSEDQTSPTGDSTSVPEKTTTPGKEAS